MNEFETYVELNWGRNLSKIEKEKLPKVTRKKVFYTEAERLAYYQGFNDYDSMSKEFYDKLGVIQEKD